MLVFLDTLRTAIKSVQQIVIIVNSVNLHVNSCQLNLLLFECDSQIDFYYFKTVQLHLQNCKQSNYFNQQLANS